MEELAVSAEQKGHWGEMHLALLEGERQMNAIIVLLDGTSGPAAVRKTNPDIEADCALGALLRDMEARAEEQPVAAESSADDLTKMPKNKLVSAIAAAIKTNPLVKAFFGDANSLVDTVERKLKHHSVSELRAFVGSTANAVPPAVWDVGTNTFSRQPPSDGSTVADPRNFNDDNGVFYRSSSVCGNPALLALSMHSEGVRSAMLANVYKPVHNAEAEKLDICSHAVRKSAIRELHALLDLKEGDSACMIGSGRAEEAISLGMLSAISKDPMVNYTITGYEIELFAFENSVERLARATSVRASCCCCALLSVRVLALRPLLFQSVALCCDSPNLRLRSAQR